MDSFSSFYEILGIKENASSEEIKSSFRKLALINHPDKNNNSLESQAKFIIIYQAYSILNDPGKREEYDIYLKTSSVLKNRRPGSDLRRKTGYIIPGKAGQDHYSIETVFSHLNFLLWEIEDFLRLSGVTFQKVNEYRVPGKEGLLDHRDFSGWEKKFGGKQLWQYLLDILIFIDKWVLVPCGFPDFFLKARNINSAGFDEYIHNITLNPGKWEHRPFVSIRDYFYNIRKRLDKLMSSVSAGDLMQIIPECGLRKIDCIFEAQNFALHNISCVYEIVSGKKDSIRAFRHSNSCFEG